MTSSEKKNKRNGIIGTILFHVLLVFAFLFMGLTYQDPPPKEEGISITFGYSDEGLGDIEAENIEEGSKLGSLTKSIESIILLDRAFL